MMYLISIILLPLVLANPLADFHKQSQPSYINVPLVTFDGGQSTTFKFHELNDPVMGGISTGSWDINEEEGFGIFNGTVKNVPSLNAPGFIAAYAKGHFNDASMALHGDLVLKVRSSTPDYEGFHVSFSPKSLSAEYACAGGGAIPFSGKCFKASFMVPSGSDFVEVRVPFSSFTDHWNQHISCSEDHPDVCPKEDDLKHIKWMEVWSDGVAGDIHLEVQSIYAELNVPETNSKIDFQETMIPLVTFDGNPDTTFRFRQQNDPVMGGESSGTWSVNEEGNYGIEDGSVRIVPSLQAPGFIWAYANGRFNDASEALTGDLILNVRSSSSDYTGYRISFGSHLIVFNDFKAQFDVPPGDEFSEVRIPFNMFSNKWDSATGDQIVTCAEDPKVCPTSNDLAHIRQVGIWAEGVEGNIHLEVQSIWAGKKVEDSSDDKKGNKLALSQEEISLITFDEEPSTTFKFKQYNDPVMGGISSGSWSVNDEFGFGVEEGEVRDVPSLQAPGFIKAQADGNFNDVSSAISGDLILRVRSNTPEYPAFRVSFGALFSREFKAKFSVPEGEEFSEIRIPFNTFSNRCSPATGEQLVTCAEDPSVCPTAETLSNLRRITLWAEGAKGDVHLEVLSISASINN